jgi:hypothetical protein
VEAAGIVVGKALGGFVSEGAGRVAVGSVVAGRLGELVVGEFSATSLVDGGVPASPLTPVELLGEPEFDAAVFPPSAVLARPGSPVVSAPGSVMANSWGGGASTGAEGSGPSPSVAARPSEVSAGPAAPSGVCEAKRTGCEHHDHSRDRLVLSPSDTANMARTTLGSKCVPAQEVSSFRAASTGIGDLYDRVAVITS